ncbi:antibiotic biosynthesis monooxygenase [Streptomyces solicathayae]|uniref:Antibiotic biosynthesis monooxygenase n=1 Tax=Streptomyces solicathayae TaxID=3081768 RepID=A0ABZ0LV55_9ACTN|nr:antibiotic biosynthesis monooxygenase [Streptomyces sp. HUAS YS2]WOX23379.1 antibiotic biosynthesis monooxygenase [Streptomyces sp. HUAS YS2]
MTQTIVAGLEPPYYTAVFTSVRPDHPEGYGETLDRMKELVQDVPGFLGYESARTPGGVGITVAYFRDLEALNAWRDHAEHRAAKKHGREHWYERYCVHIGRVEQSYGFERDDRDD